MPGSPEQKPTYLQDVIAPKETEKAPEGFDLDREFGEGTMVKLKQGLREAIDRQQPGAIVQYIVLFGRNPVGHEDARIIGLEQRLKHDIEIFARPSPNQVGNTTIATAFAHSYRVLFGELPLRQKEIEALEKASEQERNKEVLGIATTKEKSKQRYFSECAVRHRIVFGTVPWTKEQGAAMAEIFENETREFILHGDYVLAAQCAAYYRLLRAHDIKFIPGKGIEIIDTPPQFQQKPIPPMPEERKF